MQVVSSISTKYDLWATFKLNSGNRGLARVTRSKELAAPESLDFPHLPPHRGSHKSSWHHSQKKVSYKKNLKDKNGSKKPLQQIRFVQQFGSVIDWQGVLALIYCAIAHVGDLCIYHWLFDHQSQIIPTERRLQQCTSLAPKDLSKPMFHFPKGLLQTAPWKFGFYSIVTKY